MSVARVLARGQVTLPRDIRRAARIQPGDVLTFRVTGPGKIEVNVLQRLTFEEALERYRIEGPIDDAADRELWQDQAAKDILGSRHD